MKRCKECGQVVGLASMGGKAKANKMTREQRAKVMEKVRSFRKK